MKWKGYVWYSTESCFLIAKIWKSYKQWNRKKLERYKEKFIRALDGKKQERIWGFFVIFLEVFTIFSTLIVLVCFPSFVVRLRMDALMHSFGEGQCMLCWWQANDGSAVWDVYFLENDLSEKFKVFLISKLWVARILNTTYIQHIHWHVHNTIICQDQQ